MPGRTTLRQPFPTAQADDDILRAIYSVLGTMDGVKVEACSLGRNDEANAPNGILVHASGNTWSRAARRKKLTGDPVATSNSPRALICRLHVENASIGGATNPTHTTVPGQNPQLNVVFQWTRGKDRTLFESFMSHVSRKVEAALKSSDREMIL